MFSAIGNLIKWIGDHFWGMLFLLIVIAALAPNEDPANPPNLQEIKVVGTILDADSVVKEIEEAIRNKNIKGVLLDINSPGGSVPPSIEISYAIRELAKQKPVVAYASGIMASGSYYSAIYANKIIANPGAIVGSIGVIMESANVKELLDSIGIKPQTVQQGTYKQAGTPMREWTPEERAELEQLTKDTYDLFVSDVARARKLENRDSKLYADAHIFSANRAKKVGLIDQVGIKMEAKKELEKLAHVTNPKWKEKDKFESFMENIKEESILRIQSTLYSFKAIL